MWILIIYLANSSGGSVAVTNVPGFETAIACHNASEIVRKTNTYNYSVSTNCIKLY